MTTTKHAKRPVRRSITLRQDIDGKVQALARRGRTSANRVLEDLIETGLQAKESEKQRFFELAEQLESSTNTSEKRRIKEQLARMTFGN